MDDLILLTNCASMTVHSIRVTVRTLVRCALVPLTAPLPPPQPLHRLYARRVQHSQIEACIPREIPLHDFSCVDMYSRLRHDAPQWWQFTLVTPHHFGLLIRRITAILPDDHRHPMRGSLENRLLLALHWMAHYSTCSNLALQFGVSVAVVWRTQSFFAAALSVVQRVFCSDLCDPAKVERLRGRIHLFPAAIGIIDCTHHDREQPMQNQRMWYRRDIGHHTITTQVICDYTGKPIHVSAGYPGSCHDMRIFQDSGVARLLRPGDKMMADQGYMKGPFISPYGQLDPIPSHQHFNKCLKRIRIRVEQTHRYLKRFRCLSARWRHSIELQPICVIAVAGLCAEQLNEYPIYHD
jgi:hypothetical protein